MEDNLLAYIDLVLDYIDIGVLGGIAGIVGAIVSIWSYRLARSFKVRDLRLQAETLRNDTNAALRRAMAAHEAALPSRKTRFADQGILESSEMSRFQKHWEQDRDAIRTQVNALDQESVENYKSLGDAALEGKIVDLQRTKALIEEIASKYEGKLRKDEEMRASMQAARQSGRRGG